MAVPSALIARPLFLPAYRPDLKRIEQMPTEFKAPLRAATQNRRAHLEKIGQRPDEFSAHGCADHLGNIGWDAT